MEAGSSRRAHPAQCLTPVAVSLSLSLSLSLLCPGRPALRPPPQLYKNSLDYFNLAFKCRSCASLARCKAGAVRP